ncbi:anthranilate synthase component 1 [Glaciecola sp. SC05]|uniref:anthranilate synthase component 1 n=1 Tax=Glaciecola sp. SC05 TaxID=1987355 RepID=UPI0035297443
MSLVELGTAPGSVETILIDTPYVADPLRAYKALAKPHSILLESAEIDSKDNLKSLILVDAALRIECQEQKVLVSAVSNNGHSLITFLQQKLSAFVISSAPNQITLQFASADNQLDEDTRLKQASVFDVLRTIQREIKTLRSHPHAVFLGGVFAYDLLASLEVLPRVPKGLNTCPDYVFYLAETLVLIDHQQQKTEILGSVFSASDVAQNYFNVQQRLEVVKHAIVQLDEVKFSTNNRDSAVRSDKTLSVDKSDVEYCQDVINLQEHILDGDIFQVVPSRTFSLPCADSLLAYKRLKQTNPSPYMFYLQDDDFVIFGASPESALKYETRSNQVEIYPIAGTRPRGRRPDGSLDLDLDSRLELNLQQDEKEKSEHIMLVDLARNDVAKVSKPGTRHVKDLLKVDRYSHVMHLVSRVVGQLRDDLDALHAYQACMNMGTLIGAPKISAASLIRHTEKCTRGSYGGAVGYLNGNGDFDTCIVIRSAFVANHIAYIQAGAGVVKDSVPQSEADETRAKAQAVIQAIMTADLAQDIDGEAEHV